MHKYMSGKKQGTFESQQNNKDVHTSVYAFYVRGLVIPVVVAFNCVLQFKVSAGHSYICYSVQQTLFHIAISIKYCPGGHFNIGHRTLLCLTLTLTLTTLTLTLYQDTISQHRTLIHIAISMKYCPGGHFNIGHYCVLHSQVTY